MSLNGSGVMIPDERHQSMRCLGQPQELVVDHGKRYCITLINANSDSHVFHMHGHTFTTLETSTSPIRSTAGSVPEQMAAWRDSVLVPGGQCSRRTICFEADNAAGGVWPFHCHMAYHLASGMMLLSISKRVTSDVVNSLELRSLLTIFWTSIVNSFYSDGCGFADTIDTNEQPDVWRTDSIKMQRTIRRS